MRIGKESQMSLLEFSAFITSLLAVVLGVLGSRITWPWWSVSSVLYAVLFFKSTYYASAALQILFIVVAIWGWLGWGPKGAKPQKLSNKQRVQAVFLVVILSFILWPILTKIGAASSAIESFGFVGSVMAQLLMVWQKFEAWPLWLIVDLAYTYQYYQGDLFLTSLLYLIFSFIAIWGWIRWKKESTKNDLR
jgi:nicotinamide mononucleotide transporter